MVARFVAQHIERSPIAQSRMEADLVDRGTMSVMDGITPPPCTGRMSAPQVYAVGNLELRGGQSLRRRRVPLLVDGQGQNVSEMALRMGMVIGLEAALFPYLFVFGEGFWRPPPPRGSDAPRSPHATMQSYLKYRMMTLFSPFTLCKSYLMLMYQVMCYACLMSCQSLDRSLSLAYRYHK